MKILSLHIENFGKFSNFDISFVDGVNQFVHQNGWGKSTLSAFIKAMLYGMEAKGRKKDFQSQRSRFEPWQGGVYGGNLTAKIGDGKYQIFRTFGKTPEEDFFQVVDLKTNKVCKNFDTNFGEQIFGIGEETFSVSTFFVQSDIQSLATDEVVAALAGIEKYNNDAEKVEQAISLLEKKRKSLVSQLAKPFQINALASNIEQAQDKILQKQSQETQLQKQAQKLQSEHEDFLKHFEKQTEIVKEQKSQNEKRQALEQSLNQKNLQLAEELSKGSKPVKQLLLGGVAIGFGVLLFALALAKVISLALGIGVGVVFAVAGILTFVLSKPSSKQTIEIQQEIVLLQQKLLLIPKQQVDEGQLYQQKSEIDNKIAQSQFLLASCQNDLAELESELDLLRQNYSALKNENEILNKKIAITKSAIEFLQNARENVSQRFVQPLNENFLTLFEKFSANEKVKIDSKLNALIMTEKGGKNLQFLSRGYQDLVVICQRFGMLDQLYKQEKPPIILDDTFVNIDDEKFALASQIVKTLSEKYQVIYFSCSRARKIL